MIMGFLSRAWPYVALAGLVLLVTLLGKKIGGLQNALTQLEGRINLQRSMQDAANDTAIDRDSIDKRLRDGKF